MLPQPCASPWEVLATQHLSANAAPLPHVTQDLSSCHMFSSHFELEFRNEGLFIWRVIAKKKKFRIFTHSHHLGLGTQESFQNSLPIILQLMGQIPQSTKVRGTPSIRCQCHPRSHQLKIQPPSCEHQVDVEHSTCTCPFAHGKVSTFFVESFQRAVLKIWFTLKRS